MYSLIYSFEIKEGKNNEFINSWADLTKMIYKYCGSKGSRLHQDLENPQCYIAYARWPSLDLFDEANHKLPSDVSQIRKAMRDTCIEVKTLHKLKLIKDLLK